MKVEYDRETDILLIELSTEGRIDHAEQSGPFIAHTTESGRLVLLEILHASEFFSVAIKAATRGQAIEIPLVLE